jgi:3-oxoadipate enol-lactonase
MPVTDRSESGVLEVPGGRLWYEVAGSGPAVVLIHAGVADSSMWDEQFGVFAERYRVIRYDTRGFGRSPTEDVSFSNRDDLRRVLEHLAVDRAALVGVSRAGQIAIDATLEFPELVSALVPVAAGLSGYDYGDPTDTEMALINSMEAALEARDFAQLAELDVRLWADGPGEPAGRAPEHVRDRVRRMCLHNYRTHAVEGQPQPLDPPAAGRLSELRVPTLVIVGDRDTSDTIAVADYLATHIPGARKVVFENAAHMLSMEQPERFNQVVLDFLAEALA